MTAVEGGVIESDVCDLPVGHEDRHRQVPDNDAGETFCWPARTGAKSNPVGDYPVAGGPEGGR